MSDPAPIVSIGLPVYNGEAFLRPALEAILAQTFGDFEVVISDNCSTDATPDICRDYAERDPRIRYYRNDTNVGPCLNFNRTLDLARGEFFAWAAHDDRMEPAFLERCLEVLRADPDLVLCQSLVRIIDEQDNEITVYDSALTHAGSTRVSQRFRSLILVFHVCTEMFGLMRPEALRKTRRLSADYHGCDRAMLAELALVGRFAHIPEPLFNNREHSKRDVRAARPTARADHGDAAPARRVPMNTWRLYSDYFHAVRTHVDSAGDRWRCYGWMLAWWFVNWNSLRVGAELIAQVFPPFYDFAKRVKHRLVAPVHPTVHQKK